MKKKQLKKPTNEIDMKYMRDIIDKLIKNNKIKFEFYNSTIPLELLQICFNKNENTIELGFRDIQKYYIDELKKLSEQNSIK